MGHALELAVQSGDQSGVLVGDDESDPGQAPFLQAAEEAAPEHFVFAVADVDPEDLPAAGGGDPGGDHDGHRRDLTVPADVEVGGVEEHVRERGVVQRAATERRDLLVQAGADPRHLRLGDARPDPECGHEVVDRAGRHPVHPRFHHHRIQGLVDPAAALQDDREERPLTQLRDRQLHIPGLGGDHLRAGAVAVSGAAIGAFVATGADVLSCVDLDQVLHDQTH
jgi:hypothetical protein